MRYLVECPHCNTSYESDQRESSCKLCQSTDLDVQPSPVLLLGAPDPEMEAIEERANAAGCWVYYAATRKSNQNRRAKTSTAYMATTIITTAEAPPLPMGFSPFGAEETIVAVECDGPITQHVAAETVFVDHHRKGDPGFGLSPEQYWEASSLGQVMEILYGPGYEPTEEERLIAAGDHCPAAAYQGKCPGVDPAALADWRITSKARFQNRSEDELRETVEVAMQKLLHPPRMVILGDQEVADFRESPKIRELPEASLRSGLPFIAALGGKVVCQGAGEGSPAGSAPIKDFMLRWAPAHGLEHIYGDPIRGFAGGFLAPVEAKA